LIEKYKGKNLAENKNNIIGSSKQLKEVMENKESIENKLKKLEANLEILENPTPNHNNPNNHNNPTSPKNNLTTNAKNESLIVSKEIIDENIRKARIKEIKNSKMNLETSLKSVDAQIKLLIKEEEINNNKKKINIKNYLDNFQKDKQESELRVKKWKEDHKEFLKKQKADLNKSFEKEKKQKEKYEIVEKKQQELKKSDTKKYLDSLHEKSIKVHKQNEEILKVLKSKSPKKDYPHIRLEKKFNEKLKHEEDLRKEMMSHMKAEKKEKFLKPIDFNEINKFGKWYEEQTLNKKVAMDRKRITKLQAIEEINKKLLPFSKSKHYDISALEEHEFRIHVEKSKSEAYIKRKKIQNFCKIVNHHLKPEVDPYLKQDREEKIKNHNYYAHNKIHKIVYRVSFIKKSSKSMELMSGYSSERKRPRSASGKKRHNVYLKSDFINNRPLSVAPYDHENDQFEERVDYFIKKQQIRDRKTEVRKSLDKLPDYLGNLRKQRDTYASKRNHSEVDFGIRGK